MKDMLLYQSIPFPLRSTPAEVEIKKVGHGYEVRHDFGALRFSKYSDIPLRYRERSFETEIK